MAPIPPRPKPVLAAAYLCSGAAAFWLTAGLAALFAIPEYSRHYADLHQDPDAGTTAGVLLVLTALAATASAGVALLLSLLAAAAFPAARRLVYILGGTAAAGAVALLLLNIFAAVPWYRWLMASVAAITLMLVVAYGVLLALPASRAWFQLAQLAHAARLATARLARQRALAAYPGHPHTPQGPLPPTVYPPQGSPPLPTAAASTPMLAEAEGPVPEPAGDTPAPQQPYPQPLYPQASHPKRPVSSSGIATAAMVLCTVLSLSLVWSAISFVVGVPPVEGPSSMPPVAAFLANGAWTIGDILLIVGTILMWSRVSAGRILAIIGISMVLTSMLGFEFVALSTPHDSIVRPWTYAINVLSILSLAFVLLPDTGRYLEAVQSSPYASSDREPSHVRSGSHTPGDAVKPYPSNGPKQTGSHLSQLSPNGPPQQYDMPAFGPGNPIGRPLQRSRMPWIVGAIAPVMVVVVAAMLFFVRSGVNDNPPDSITYEISGTAPGPLSVSYSGSDGNDVDVTVGSLPWSVTVTPAPDFVSIFAISLSIESDADITLTLKRGTEVLRKCHGGGPCLMPFPP